eukprot:comp6387_c0_seq1/m.2187 comp6387_c0_seq1/g.2187  ORF comp6387_c0_seq1/g.2187 comp6387_c0_seq1/m.2187 type:complete len:336 (-) comp6387_c0_seq1:109-1116(-)
MPLFETHPVSREQVASAVKEHWGLTLGDRLKESQNHTFVALDDTTGDKFAVRATPDPTGAHHKRISDELAFVGFVAEKVPGVCAPVHPKSSLGWVVRDATTTICVSKWAEGAPVDFLGYRWMTDKEIVLAWGAWLARLHAASREFSRAHPDVAGRMQEWDEVHSRVMAGTPISPEDTAVVGDVEHYGVLHGDCNASNFFLVDHEGKHGDRPALSVFDWDQAQLGWYEYDLAQAMLGPTMLAEGGSLPAGDPVPEARPKEFEDYLVEGYESVAGVGSVDRARLSRMLELRKLFYAKFCSQAAREGGAPPDMAWFIDYINRWFERWPVKCSWMEEGE